MPIDADRWKKAKEVFETAVDMPAEDRAAFIRSICGNDDELTAEIKKLLEGDENARSFLEKPLFDPPCDTRQLHNRRIFSPGEIICDRFTIVAFLGEGGMGQVYEAHDAELRERIALKTIHSEIASNPSALLRFKQEIQITRRITHPNICRTFDFEKAGPRRGTNGEAEPEVVFLTMELLQGETLEVLLKRKNRLGVNETLTISTQLSGALGAAHNAGIIHRDLKPSNILLVPGESDIRAVVTDFGLARAVFPDRENDSRALGKALTATGQMFGTLAYMAPEQLEGNEATVETDIYAFGLILYEMLSGRRPFAGSTSFAEVANRLREKPTSLGEICPSLPPSWEATINRCLEVVPASRFKNMQELLNSLDKKDEGCSATGKRPVSATRDQSGPSKPEAFLPRKYLLLLVFLGLFVALFLGSLRLYRRGVNLTRIPEGAELLLTDISNQSGDSHLDAITESLRSQLSQSAYVNLLDPSRRQETLTRMGRSSRGGLDPATEREVAIRNGAPLVLFGAVSKVSDDFRLDLKLERVGSNPERSTNTWKFSETATSKNMLLETVRRGGVWVRKVIGENESEIQNSDRRPEEVTTENWEALRLYSKGQELAASDRLEDAILEFKEATEKDPKFAMAWMRIGDTLDTIGRSGEGLSCWQKALEVSGDRRLSPREELRIKGMFANDTGDLVGAVQYFNQYSLEFPNDYLGYFYRGYPLMLLGRPEEAVVVVKKAEVHAPGSFEVADHLARYSMIVDDLETTTHYIGRLKQLSRAENASQLEGQRHVLIGDFQGAQKFFFSLRSSNDPYLRTISYQLEASALTEIGKYRDAMSVLNAGIKADLPVGNTADRADKYLALAYLYLRKRQPAECRSAVHKSLEIASSAERIAEAGSLLSRCGFVGDAKELQKRFDQAEQFPTSRVAQWRLKGEILLEEGKTRLAMAELRKAKAADQKIGLLRDYWLRAAIANHEWNEANTEIDRLLEHSGQVWHQPELYPPGTMSELAFLRAKLACQLGFSTFRQQLTAFLERQRDSDADLPEVAEAQAMLRGEKPRFP